MSAEVNSTLLDHDDISSHKAKKKKSKSRHGESDMENSKKKHKANRKSPLMDEVSVGSKPKKRRKSNSPLIDVVGLDDLGPVLTNEGCSDKSGKDHEKSKYKMSRKRKHSEGSSGGEPRGKRGVSTTTYILEYEKLDQLLSRAKELVKTWKEPKEFKSKEEEEIEKFRLACQNQTIGNLKNELLTTSRAKQTNPTYMLMELRKSLISHDWNGVKKILQIFYSSSNENDKVGWKACITALMYYPGGEAALQSFIEENKMNYSSRDILCGLLSINGLQPFDSNSSKSSQASEIFLPPKELELDGDIDLFEEENEINNEVNVSIAY